MYNHVITKCCFQGKQFIHIEWLFRISNLNQKSYIYNIHISRLLSMCAYHTYCCTYISLCIFLYECVTRRIIFISMRCILCIKAVITSLTQTNVNGRHCYYLQVEGMLFSGASILIFFDIRLCNEPKRCNKFSELYV